MQDSNLYFILLNLNMTAFKITDVIWNELFLNFNLTIILKVILYLKKNKKNIAYNIKTLLTVLLEIKLHHYQT
jgi:hypothetical protein